jgi:mono/diheme cytochrome c family protein
MKVRARTVVLCVLGLVLLLGIAVITAVGWQVVLGPRARAVTSRTFERSDARMARGKYLVEGGAHCFHCHSEHDLTVPEYPIVQAKMGAGWELPIPELGRITSPNITPDRDTGIGTWTDDEIARAIQEGVDKNGKALFPVMPYEAFSRLDDEDLASIIVYLRSIPAVRNVVPERKLIFPLNFIVNTIPVPLAAHAAPAARTTPEARGEYLVRAVAGCDDCHTPKDDKGQPLPGLAYGGGQLFHDPGPNGKEVFSANITRDPSGIEYYDEALFIQTIRTGQTKGRTLNHIMPFEFYKNITDDDLKDIWAWVRSQPPVKHRVSNVDPPTKCPVCNQTHGLGELNVRVEKSGSREVGK